MIHRRQPSLGMPCCPPSHAAIYSFVSLSGPLFPKMSLSVVVAQPLAKTRATNYLADAPPISAIEMRRQPPPFAW